MKPNLCAVFLVLVFFILAVLGLEVFGVILAGYSSASKWSLFGAMREAAQVVSYEVPLGLCVVVLVLIAVQVLFFAKYDEWNMSTYGQRFLLTTVALSSVFLTALLSRLLENDWRSLFPTSENQTS